MYYNFNRNFEYQNITLHTPDDGNSLPLKSNYLKISNDNKENSYLSIYIEFNLDKIPDNFTVCIQYYDYSISNIKSKSISYKKGPIMANLLSDDYGQWKKVIRLHRYFTPRHQRIIQNGLRTK